MRRLRGLGVYASGDVAAVIAAAAGRVAPMVSPESLLQGEDPRLTADQQEQYFLGRAGQPDTRHGRDYRLAAPWIEPPVGAEPFDFPGVIATPAAGVGETVVLTVDVPPGFDGVIRRLSHNYTGGGFVAGTGNLVWRLRRNNQAVKNYDNILIEFGSLVPQSSRQTDGIRICQRQRITYTVEHMAGSPLAVAGTSIICFLCGWFYPLEE